MKRKNKLFRFLSAVLALTICLSSILILGGCKDKEGLNILIYGQYLAPEAVEMFENETGIRVYMDECDTPEELYNKAVNGDNSYDLICTSDYVIERFIAEDRLSPINYDNIPNKKNIGDIHWESTRTFDPEIKYSIPHFWGTVGVIYDTTVVSEEDAKSWGMFFDPKYADQIIMANSIRDSFLVALKYLGYSLNTTDKKEIDEAKELLLKQKDIVKAYQMESEARDSMICGDAAMAIVYNGEAYIAIEGDEDLGIKGNPKLAFTVPEEGTNLWMDSWVIPKYAKDKAAAEKFLNTMCSVEAAEYNFNYIYYSTPNQALIDSFDDDIKSDEAIFPSEELMRKSELMKSLSQDLTDYYGRAWKEIKAK